MPDENLLLGLVGVVSAFWGKLFYILILYVACMLFSYVSGVLVTLKSKCWKSYNFITGVWRIVGSVCAVVAGGTIDLLIEFMNFHFDSVNLHIGEVPVFCCLVIGWCILTESRRIIKNAEKLGYGVPRFLGTSILKLRDEIDEISDEVQGVDTNTQRDDDAT